MQIFISSRDFLLDHLAAVRSSVTVKNKADAANLELLRQELETLAKRHARLSLLRNATFVLLYASLLSNLALPALDFVIRKFTLVANLLGAGILSLLALYLTWRLGQLWNRMAIVGSHSLAIYEKHNKSVYAVRKGRSFALECLPKLRK